MQAGAFGLWRPVNTACECDTTVKSSYDWEVQGFTCTPSVPGKIGVGLIQTNLAGSVGSMNMSRCSDGMMNLSLRTTCQNMSSWKVSRSTSRKRPRPTRDKTLSTEAAKQKQDASNPVTPLTCPARPQNAPSPLRINNNNALTIKNNDSCATTHVGSHTPRKTRRPPSCVILESFDKVPSEEKQQIVELLLSGKGQQASSLPLPLPLPIPIPMPPPVPAPRVGPKPCASMV